jgi:uncharacterized membrane protein
MDVSVISLNLSFVIAVALATVLLLIFIALGIGVIYYRWRTTELMSGISYFICENRKLEKQIDKLNEELTKNHTKQ